MKVVINTSYGGLGLSKEAMLLYGELKGVKIYVIEEGVKFYVIKVSVCNEYLTVPPEQLTPQKIFNYEAYMKEHISDKDISRDDPILIQVIEELGSKKASWKYAKLKIVEIPDNVEWEIQEYDGKEHVAEKHRTWS